MDDGIDHADLLADLLGEDAPRREICLLETLEDAFLEAAPIPLAVPLEEGLVAGAPRAVAAPSIALHRRHQGGRHQERHYEEPQSCCEELCGSRLR